MAKAKAFSKKKKRAPLFWGSKKVKKSAFTAIISFLPLRRSHFSSLCKMLNKKKGLEYHVENIKDNGDFVFNDCSYGAVMVVDTGKPNIFANFSPSG